METISDAIVVKHVIEGNQTHALVVSHESANQNMGLTLWQPFECVINGLEITIGTERTILSEPTQVIHGHTRFNFSREHCRVRCHDQILNQTALQTQTRNAKRSVLIVQVEVADVVGGLGDTPGNTAFFAVFDLSPYNGA